MESSKLLCCMNGLCGASLSSTSTSDIKKGWPLRSGESATLCHNCGSAYEQLIFCDTFHLKDTGWRECTSCGKRLHCGCIASSSLLELLDTGGVNCINCAKKSEPLSTSNYEKLKGCGLSTINSAGEMQSSSVGSQLNGASIDKLKLTQFSDSTENSTQKVLLLNQMDDGKMVSNAQLKVEESSSIPGEAGSLLLSRCTRASGESSQNIKMDMYKGNIGGKDANESLVLTNLSMALASPITNTNLLSGVVIEEGEVSKTISSFHQGSRSRHLLPKPPKYVMSPGLETGTDMVAPLRVARPPVEGRIKNQLLPRYWPRITDQELQQISGESNATIVPLFEKVLSASDAGRIGRLVLPKACAEAYFPPISQPEGLPLRIQDVKGKEWVFQFRFWPNNNSRMYVLEGVTPCIQSMQLQAGDTVTFSRMDPGGKLLMGFRKASTVLTQDAHLSSISKSTYPSEPFFSDVTGNLSSMSGYSGFLQSLKASANSSFAKECSSGDMNLRITEKVRSQAGDIPLPPSMLVPERKRSRNIGSKSKRLVIDSEDALELKLSWEEVQDMLRPPLTVEPSTFMIDDHEFEEYEEPPVFAKRSIFTVRLSGVLEQWAECDSCLKWRRLPADFLLPAKWTCQDNNWDDNRCSCSAPDELSPRELENLLTMNKDRLGNAAAAASVGGDIMSDSGGTSVATTTKHPRHRPGCSCIVCIQPPSGKGKHKPTCTCNVCMTVKRRFKTLMMRKKKRQSEREAEIAQRNQFMWSRPDELEVDSICRQVTSQSDPLENKRTSGIELQLRSQLQESAEIGNGQLDLNSNPDREDLHTKSSCASMMSLLQEANMPLETYLKQNGLTSLVNEQQGSSGSQALPQATGESIMQVPEDNSQPPGTLEQGDEEEISESDHSGNNPS